MQVQNQIYQTYYARRPGTQLECRSLAGVELVFVQLCGFLRQAWYVLPLLQRGNYHVFLGEIQKPHQKCS